MIKEKEGISNMLQSPYVGGSEIDVFSRRLLCFINVPKMFPESLCHFSSAKGTSVNTVEAHTPRCLQEAGSTSLSTLCMWTRPEVILSLLIFLEV